MKTSKIFAFQGLFQEGKWICPAYVSIDRDGKIIQVDKGRPTEGAIEEVPGFAMPGFQNAHSHAFQFAMAGLAENHPPGQSHDNFWSWREAMYQLALQVDPDQMEDIASMLYSEMLTHGFTHVAEFHYLHHDVKGQAYSNISEMGDRLISAAKKTGMGITLVPIFYQKGGFGQEANPRQRRFLSPDLEAYMHLWEASEKSIGYYEHAQIGMGAHSLRAVSLDQMHELVDVGKGKYPFHIHVSEQRKEVEDCIVFTGKRPVEWLLQGNLLHPDMHLVHATHLEEVEIEGITKSGAKVVLCPSTEGNLGDGIFPLKKFLDHGGQWSIGTDSHVGLGFFEELRILDYGQRLIHHQRNTFGNDSGSVALKMAQQAGRKAMKLEPQNVFAIGESFDAVILKGHLPLAISTKSSALSSTFVYCADRSWLAGTIKNGQWLVRNGRHRNGEIISSRFRKTMESLKNRS